MLSNPTTSLHARQRQHRRQNSTPSGFEGVKIPTLPNAHQRQAAGHRRGLSLDTRRRPQHQTTSPTSRQEYAHPVLREAQQQRIKARPGTHHHQFVSIASSDNESYLISPHGTPQSQRFDASCFDPSSIPFDPYSGQLDLMTQKQQNGFGADVAGTRDFELFTTDSALSTPTFMNFQDSPTAQGWISEGDTASTRRSSRRISNGIMDRVNKFETLALDDMQRPITPPNPNATSYFPPTPMETPHERMLKHQPRPERFSEGYDESMEETIKPTRNRGSQRTHTIFQDMRRQAEHQSIVPAPRQPSSLSESQSFTETPVSSSEYMSMNSFNEEFIKLEHNYDSSQGEGPAVRASSALSQHSTPNTPQIGQFAGGFANTPDLHPYGTIKASQSDPTSRRIPPHRRTDSMASIASAASISSINIEETKTETGVTLEEISQYIQGPDAVDGKWTCIFEGCGKKFGRKENIKSHVQTHLNDRQYQCPTCQKCFVRQHDLKRHAKIHTGVKPYPCECGNSFARHDALTRHRQRGMCIGAFDGVVRKVVKRGRPRKNRPDMETRLEKSARTRKKNLSISSVSSQSGYSDSSVANSPENDYNMLDEMIDMGMDSQPMASMSSAPMPVIAQRVVASPEAESIHSYVSPEAIMERTPSHVASPAKSLASQYNTPPELSQSSSPPATNFFETEPTTSSGLEELSSLTAGSSVMTSASMDGTLPLGISGLGDQDDDMYLQFTHSDGMVQLDRDPSMLMMSKFDEEFDNAVNMYSHDDIFFGTS
ncbi:Metallothionein expression activator [Paramyrothecium foliicola]|nr:Metallothionein expression activator [Paramyrothecium foliicola]